MSDFQPLFTSSPAKAEFKPLSDSVGADGFEVLDFGIAERESAGVFQPTLGDKAEVGSQSTKSAQDEAGADLEDSVKAGLDENPGMAGPVAADAENDVREPESSLVDSSPSESASQDGELGESSEGPALLDSSDPVEQGAAADDAAADEDAEAGSDELVPSDPSTEAGSEEIDPAVRAIEAAAARAGYEAGLMRGKAEIAERLKEVSDILAQVQGLRAEFFSRAVQDVGATVTRVAEQVIRRELSVSSGDIEGLIRNILSDVQGDDDFVLRVSEADAETIEDISPTLRDLIGRDAELRIEVDSRLLPGGAVVETSYGRIDASIEQQLEAFSASVESWVSSEVEANNG